MGWAAGRAGAQEGLEGGPAEEGGGGGPLPAIGNQPEEEVSGGGALPCIFWRLDLEAAPKAQTSSSHPAGGTGKNLSLTIGHSTDGVTSHWHQ